MDQATEPKEGSDPNIDAHTDLSFQFEFISYLMYKLLTMYMNNLVISLDVYRFFWHVFLKRRKIKFSKNLRSPYIVDSTIKCNRNKNKVTNYDVIYFIYCHRFDNFW